MRKFLFFVVVLLVMVSIAPGLARAGDSPEVFEVQFRIDYANGHHIVIFFPQATNPEPLLPALEKVGGPLSLLDEYPHSPGVICRIYIAEQLAPETGWQRSGELDLSPLGSVMGNEDMQVFAYLVQVSGPGVWGLDFKVHNLEGRILSVAGVKADEIWWEQDLTTFRPGFSYGIEVNWAAFLVAIIVLLGTGIGLHYLFFSLKFMIFSAWWLLVRLLAVFIISYLYILMLRWTGSEAIWGFLAGNKNFTPYPLEMLAATTSLIFCGQTAPISSNLKAKVFRTLVFWLLAAASAMVVSRLAGFSALIGLLAVYILAAIYSYWLVIRGGWQRKYLEHELMVGSGVDILQNDLEGRGYPKPIMYFLNANKIFGHDLRIKKGTQIIISWHPELWAALDHGQRLAAVASAFEEEGLAPLSSKVKSRVYMGIALLALPGLWFLADFWDWKISYIFLVVTVLLLDFSFQATRQTYAKMAMLKAVEKTRNPEATAQASVVPKILDKMPARDLASWERTLAKELLPRMLDVISETDSYIQANG